jgi:predicted nucleic acid-binding protein
VPRFSLDSNILVYSVDNRDQPRRDSALEILNRAVLLDCVLVPQSLAEFFAVISRKGIMPRSDAAAQMQDWMQLFTVSAGPTGATVIAAAAAATAGRFQFYDALLLATAGAAGCEVVISEDMAHGAELAGVRVVAAFDPAGGIGAEALALLGG